MKRSDLVSIISPCYNGEKYLSLFLDSVLSQTYKDIELIVVDDASTDRTEDILKKYIPLFSEKNIIFKIITKDVNGGQAAAINEALPIFSGEYMMWMDSDDILYPCAIEKKVAFLKNNPDLDFCLCWGEVVNSDELSNTVGILRRVKSAGNDNLFEDLINCRNVVFCPGSILVKSDSFKKIIPSLHIYESREGQNWQLMLPLAYSLKYGYIEEPLFKYVVHNDSHSHSKRGFIQQIRRQNNFIILLNKTIENIEAIKEKQPFYDLVTIARTKEKLNIALCHCRLGCYIQCKRVLKNFNVRLSISEHFFIFQIKRVFYKVKNIFRKVKRK